MGITIRKELLFLIAAGIVIIYFVTKVGFKKKINAGKIDWHDYITMGLFLYFTALIGVTLFPIVIPPNDIPYQIDFVNWDLTIMFNYGSKRSLLENVGGNILMFIPLLPLIELKLFPKKISLLGAIGISLGVSMAIEGLQYMENIFAIAVFPIRVTDISDVVLNGIGGISGYVIFNIWKHYIGARS